NEQPPAKADALPAEQAAARTMRVVVLDPQGKPLPGANLLVGIWTDEKDFKRNRNYETDAAGIAQVELPRTFTILRLWADKKQFVTLFANGETAELASGRKVPSEYTFRMEPGVAAGGQVVDEQGKPVAGARVRVRLGANLKPIRGDGRAGYSSPLT